MQGYLWTVGKQKKEKKRQDDYAELEHVTLFMTNQPSQPSALWKKKTCIKNSG
jgi:hypothetical protein